MTITIELRPEEAASLAPLAQEKGLSLPQYVQQLASEATWHAQVRAKNAEATKVLKRMQKEDSEHWTSLGEAEKAASHADWKDFKQSVNEWALSDRPRFTEED